MAMKAEAERARTIAKIKINRGVTKLRPLLCLRGEQARAKSDMIQQLWKQLQNDRESFRKAHKTLHDVTLEATSNEAEDLDSALSSLDKYQGEIEDQSEDLSTEYHKFIAHLDADNKRRELKSYVDKCAAEMDFIKKILIKVQNGDLGKEAFIDLPIEETCVLLTKILNDWRDFAVAAGEDWKRDSEEILEKLSKLRVMAMEFRALKVNFVQKSTLTSSTPTAAPAISGNGTTPVTRPITPVTPLQGVSGLKNKGEQDLILENKENKNPIPKTQEGITSDTLVSAIKIPYSEEEELMDWEPSQ